PRRPERRRGGRAGHRDRHPGRSAAAAGGPDPGRTRTGHRPRNRHGWPDRGVATANLTRSETAARSAAVTVGDYRVELDLSDAPDQDRPGFTTVTTVRFDATTTRTWLDFLGLTVDSVTLNGRAVAVDYDGARLTLDGLADTNEVTVRATAA